MHLTGDMESKMSVHVLLNVLISSFTVLPFSLKEGGAEPGTDWRKEIL